MLLPRLSDVYSHLTKIPQRFATATSVNFVRLVLIYWVWVVTAIDVYWTIHNQELMVEVEKNPMALWIIVGFGIEALCAAKVVGTMVVTEILRRARMPIVVGVAAFQTWLFWMLMF